jgi:hypothetical protein
MLVLDSGAQAREPHHDVCRECVAALTWMVDTSRAGEKIDRPATQAVDPGIWTSRMAGRRPSAPVWDDVFFAGVAPYVGLT